VRREKHSAAQGETGAKARQPRGCSQALTAAACVFSASLCQVDAASAASGLPSDQIRLLICLLAAVPLGPSRRCSLRPLCPTALRCAAANRERQTTSFNPS
jgi:hypothetical protein